jgi:ribosomal protein S18 acetylase RimI-like enzyme
VLAAGGASRAKLEVRASNEAAQALYRSFGFSAENVISGYYDDGEDAKLFVADLTGGTDGGD